MKTSLRIVGMRGLIRGLSLAAMGQGLVLVQTDLTEPACEAGQPQLPAPAQVPAGPESPSKKYVRNSHVSRRGARNEAQLQDSTDAART